MNYREITSEITNILKLNNKDDRTPTRFILRLLKDASTFLISQKWGERSLMTETNLFTSIPCFEFERVVSRDCPSIEFRMCDILMKSKKKLPKLIFSRLGSSIRDIVALDGDFVFTFVEEGQYRRNKKRQYSLKNEVYVYLGADNHLYIPDHEIFSLDLTVLTVDTEETDNSSACKDKANCKNNWDSEFICPDKLLEATKDIVLQRLSIMRQIREDSNPNNVEGI